MVILQNIPLGINRRLSNISSDSVCFNGEKHDFQEALKVAGYSHVLDYDIGLGKMQRYGPPPPYTRPTISEDGIPTREKTHGRNVIWFNPPFNLYCSTNVGQIFRRLIETHFTKNDIVSKLFNKNKVKLIYGCRPIIKAKVS